MGDIKGKTIWFCGLPSSGKSTLAEMLHDCLNGDVELLDGDVIRKNLVSLGFGKNERIQNIERIRWLCNLLNRHNITVIVAAITPYKEMRKENRKYIMNYTEIWTKASIEKCMERDVKGLYKKAKLGLISNMTGINDPFDSLDNPNLICNTDIETKEESLEKIKKYLGMNTKL